tara:strand:- start:1324 stop:1530 length:207 start_codon:yes stop_codon:yes gene_type:complete
MEELKDYIGKEIKFNYSDKDKEIMNLPSDYFEIFIGEFIIDEDGTELLYNSDYQWITLEYAKENIINQ